MPVNDYADHTSYIDLKNNHRYDERPEVLKFWKIEMLKVGKLYYSRTKHIYKSRPGMTNLDIIPRSFYLRIYDGFSDNRKFKYVDGIDTFLHRDCVCILAGDKDEYYWFCGEAGRRKHRGCGRKREILPCNGQWSKGIYRLRTSKDTRGRF